MVIRTGQAYKVSMQHLRRTLFSAVILALAACAKEDSPEQQVRAVIDEIEAAAEARDVGDVMEHVSNQYRNADGQSRDEISRYVHGYFIANQSIRLLTRVEQIDFPSQEEAKAKVLVGMIGREAQTGADWNLVADLYEFDVVFIREGDGWKATYAEWNRR